MDPTYCLGCQTRLEQSQKLPPPNSFTEYKNYRVPIKDTASKWDILKTILSFINTRGGAIYIGIDLETYEANGIFLQRKQRDTFKLFMNQLLKNVHPNIDFDNKTKIDFAFIPLFKEGYFLGNYVVKIVVQQGDPSQLYYFSQKIKLENTNGSQQTEEVKVFYSYKRDNEKIVQIKQQQLLEALYERSSNPQKINLCFHPDCNPQLPQIQIQISTIKITGINEPQNDMIRNFIKDYFDKNLVDRYEHKANQKTVEIIIEDDEDFTQIKDYIVDNLNSLEEIIAGASEEPVNMEPIGNQFHYYHIRTFVKRNKKINQERKAENPKKFPILKPQEDKVKSVSKSKQVKSFMQEVTNKSKSFQNGLSFAVTFTHILPKNNDHLQKFITQQLCKKIKKKFIHYFNSITVVLENENERYFMLQQYKKKKTQFQAFGFKGDLRVGVNQRKIKICNADWSRRQQMIGLVQKYMKDSAVKIQFKNNTIQCSMRSQELACWWLDQLLKIKELKSFSRKGAYDQNNVAKMKIYLDVQI